MMDAVTMLHRGRPIPADEQKVKLRLGKIWSSRLSQHRKRGCHRGLVVKPTDEAFPWVTVALRIKV